MGKQILKQARFVIARVGKKSVTSRGWLARLNFKVDKSSEKSEYNNNIINNINIKTNKTEMSPELKQR